MICETKHLKSHCELHVPKSTVFADKSQNSGRPRLGGNFFLSFAVSHQGYGMDVSLLITRLFAHKNVEMHSLHPIYPEHLSWQQEPGVQGRGAGVWGLWRLQTHGAKCVLQKHLQHTSRTLYPSLQGAVSICLEPGSS